MAGKNLKNKKQVSSEEKRISRQRRILQIFIVIFSIILILSMILSQVVNF